MSARFTDWATQWTAGWATWSPRDWTALYWDAPWVLWLLVWVPLWLLLHWRRPVRWMQSPVVLLHPWLLTVAGAGASAAPSSAPSRAGLLLRALAWVALIVALAQPREVVTWIDPPPIGRDIALVIDVSDSMTRADFKLQGRDVSRMQMVRQVLTDFVQQRSADRFSLLVFGNGASVLMPPTFDRKHVLYQIQRLQTGLLGDGTALGDALALALKQIRYRELQPTVLVIGDGDPSNAGQVLPAEALAAALAAKVQIHALQLGRSAVPADDPQAREQPRLQDMARLTGGQYQAVQDAAQAVRFLHQVSQAAPNLKPPPTQRIVKDWMHLPLLLALLCLVLAWVLDGWRQGGAARRRTGAPE